MKTRPSFAEFKKMTHQGNLIPVYREFLADTETPVSAYLKLKDNSYSYLLESADGGKRWGRYSFIGHKPYIRVVSQGRNMEIWEEDKLEILKGVNNPVEVLRELSAKFKPVTIGEFPPFQGGFVGYFNYDLVRKWERLPRTLPQNRDFPEAIFTACRHLIIFDHFTHMIRVITFAYLKKEEDLKSIYDRACQEVMETIEELRMPGRKSISSHLLS